MSFFLLLCNVVLLNVVLSGDNALAISMVASELPQSIRRKAIVLGSVISILSLIVFIVVGSFVIRLPLLKSIAGVLLLWIAIHLVLDQKGGRAKEDSVSDSLSGNMGGANGLKKAILMIIVADLSMELDNALAMVSVADGNLGVLVAGFIVTIPFLILGSHFIAKLIQKFDWIIYASAAYIAWIAGSMIANDAIFKYISWEPLMLWIVPIISVVVFFTVVLVHSLKSRQSNHAKGGRESREPENRIAL